jgi:hypothetical protein
MDSGQWTMSLYAYYCIQSHCFVGNCPRLEFVIQVTMEEKVRGKGYGGDGGFST